MNLGAHISAAGGVQNAPLNAHKIGCETYQFFSRPPQGGSASDLTSEIISKFKSNNKKFNFKNYYIHSPYYINLASADNKIYKNSIRILREELERGSLLGVKGMMFHPGSAKDSNREDAINRVSTAISEILKNYTGRCKLLIENSAGAGNVIGDDFEEIKAMVNKQSTINNKKIGICLDTCHMFASGYNMRDKNFLQKTLNEFDKKIGLKKLEVIHLNDSKHELNSHKDRHEHLGQGKIGLAGFRAIINEPRFKNMDFVLETPSGVQRESDLNLLKQIRDNRK